MNIFRWAGLLLLLLPIISYSQTGKGISIEPTIHIGEILKHTPNLLFSVENISAGIELNFTNKKYGKKAWHQQLKYPKGGVALFYYNLGNNKLFGQSIGIVPNITFSVFSIKKLDSSFQLGWGLAYVSKRFDPIDNPQNNALGSNFNSINTFKYQIGYRLTPSWKVNLGASFTHYSNGASQLPNFGINIPALAIGAVFTPIPIEKEDIIQHDLEKLTTRWGVSVHLDLAYRELKPAGGPSYPFYVASLSAVYRLSAVQELSLGIDYEYNKSLYVFGLHTTTFRSESEARRASTRLGIFLADEFLFGNVGLFGQLGTYIPGYNRNTRFFLYTKLAMRYYMPPFGKPKTKFYIGLYLKAHKVTAEYLAIGIGARL